MSLPFAEIAGHDRIRLLLAGAVRAQRLPPALLFAGPAGVGKKALALAVGRACLCEAARATGEPCGTCRACDRARRGLHPDLVFIEPATANAIKIDQVRDAVREIGSRPFEGAARAVVFDEAHLLTEEAANALLKSLEEPPATSHVVLVTGSPQALLPTIRSRCQALTFGPLPFSVVEGFLRERGGLSAEEARLRATLADGSLGAALALESEAYRGVREQALSLLEASVAGGSILDRMDVAETLAESETFEATLTTLRSLLRDVAAVGAGAPADRLLNADVAPRLEHLGRSPLGPRALSLADVVADLRTALRGNANKLLSADLLVDALAG